jgi:hypothetical protein
MRVRPFHDPDRNRVAIYVHQVVGVAVTIASAGGNGGSGVKHENRAVLNRLEIHHPAQRPVAVTGEQQVDVHLRERLEHMGGAAGDTMGLLACGIAERMMGHQSLEHAPRHIFEHTADVANLFERHTPALAGKAPCGAEPEHRDIGVFEQLVNQA